jgi:tRNA (guanine37-N1)-methyltransferase
MQFDILTLFPKMFDGVLNDSILKRAQNDQIIGVKTHNLRDFAPDKHHTVDDTPYGGGTGMLLKVDVVDKALKEIIRNQIERPKVILLSPQGKRFNARMAQNLAKEKQLVLICGHYEGFDQRIRDHLIDMQISIGDYVLTGGELPAMVLVDAISRFVPGVLPEGAPNDDSFSIRQDGKAMLEYPQYTKPAEYSGWTVPDVLLSGDHAKIEQWRKSQLKKIK